MTSTNDNPDERLLDSLDDDLTQPVAAWNECALMGLLADRV